MEIKQVNSASGRHYVVGNHRLVSVTTLLDAFDDFDKESWYISLAKAPHLSRAEQISIGQELGQKIRNDCAIRGTGIHSQIEDHFLKNIPLKLEKKHLQQLIEDYIQPHQNAEGLLIEKKTYWVKDGVGFAGTYDLCTNFKKEFKVYKKDESLKVGRAILDWKNTRKAKYPVGFRRKDSKKYYPLTKYFLQLAAYVGAYNQNQPVVEEKLNETMVVVNPESTKLAYVYYCNPEKTLFYWDKFKEMMSCYYQKKPFNWDYFSHEIQYNDAIPTRLEIE